MEIDYYQISAIQKIHTFLSLAQWYNNVNKYIYIAKSINLLDIYINSLNYPMD